MLIDTDVHEMLSDIEQLHPYLDSWIREMHEHYGNPEGLAVTPVLPYAALHRGRREWVLDDGTTGTALGAMREHLFEKEGVTTAILNGFYHVSARKAGYEYAQALAKAYNDWQIAEWLEQDYRLRGSVHVVAHDPEAAAREIDRVAKHPQIVQVFLPTVTDRQYGDPIYRPIFEAALRNDLVITFHHGEETRTPLGYPRYYVEWHTVAAPGATMNQIMSLIANGVFDRYPDLKCVFLEAGTGWIEWFMNRFDQNYRENRLEVPWLKKLPSEHMRSHIRLATHPLGDMTARRFARLVEDMRAEEMFVFATDYPHYDADSADTFLPATLDSELRERVWFRNALETYPRLAAFTPPAPEAAASIVEGEGR
jgi:predicted TIM-barrel fold metal-dependent hydrolase